MDKRSGSDAVAVLVVVLACGITLGALFYAAGLVEFWLAAAVFVATLAMLALTGAWLGLTYTLWAPRSMLQERLRSPARSEGQPSGIGSFMVVLITIIGILLGLMMILADPRPGGEALAALLSVGLVFCAFAVWRWWRSAV